MSALFQNLLVWHVILGVLGVAALYAVWMNLLKREPPVKFLRRASFSGFVFLILSWLTGGYYYAIYYGAKVKPVILGGPYPWAHALFMEAKEHVFLFLPFMSLAVFFAVWFLGDKIGTDLKLKKSLAYFAGLAAILGIIITLAGVVISGAVR